MADEPAKKRDWAVAFLGRICLIGWICAIFYEAFDFLKPVRQICLFFGPWACVIALLHSLALWTIRRQGIFLIFILIALPPTIHFGYVLRNIAVEKKWIDPTEFGGPAVTAPKETEPKEEAPDRSLSR